jgi:hypothetical protein
MYDQSSNMSSWPYFSITHRARGLGVHMYIISLAKSDSGLTHELCQRCKDLKTQLAPDDVLYSLS